MTEVSQYYGDNLTKNQRSAAMRAVKRRDTRPEIELRAALRRRGVTNYRVDVSDIPGRPDIGFHRQQLAVFVDGAFWHGRADRIRPGRSEYWDSKIQRNVERDRRTDKQLRDRGWKVLRLWDDEILLDPDAAARRVIRRLLARPTAEFFAGIGLVGRALETCGFRVVFANDIDGVKQSLFVANNEASASKFVCGDIRSIRGNQVPDVELATASFPCIDLSLAGNRQGLNGRHSSTFWEFVRILHEMERRRPRALLVENVAGFVSSSQGKDLALAIGGLNELGYYCDLVQLDAQHWVPQSRSRLFIIASSAPLKDPEPFPWTPSEIRPAAICDFAIQHPELKLQAARLPGPPRAAARLADFVERIPQDDRRWWEPSRVRGFLDSLSPVQMARLSALRAGPGISWRAAYRRTRRGRAVWEVRRDEIAGCLRTAKGGSSKQAIVETGEGELRIRWMTAREYASLMGAPDLDLSKVSENQALGALGDAVCVPVIQWLGDNYLGPLLDGDLTPPKHTNGSATS